MENELKKILLKKVFPALEKITYDQLVMGQRNHPRRTEQVFSLPPQLKLFAHHFNEVYEYMYLLEGECLLNLGGVVFHLQKGDFTIVKRNLVHNESFVKTGRTYETIWFSHHGIGILQVMNCWYSADDEYRLRQRLTVTIPPDFFHHIDEIFRALKTGESKKEWQVIREKFTRAFALLGTNLGAPGAQCSEGSPQRWRKQALAVKTLAYLEAHLGERLTLDKISTDLAVSPSYLEEAFKAYGGITPFEYLVKVRLNKALVLMRNPGLTIAEISYQVGYEDPLYFSKLFKKFTGYSPQNYRDTFIAEGKNPFSS
jgi:AraC-like DNA-binding protein/quercetin dioxygenase-like cupin family protein